MFHLPRRSFHNSMTEFARKFNSERNLFYSAIAYGQNYTKLKTKPKSRDTIHWVGSRGEHLKYKTARNHLPRMDGGLARNDTRAWQLYTRMHILLSLSRLSWLDFFVSLLAALLSHSSHSFPATGPSAMKLAKEKKNRSSEHARRLSPTQAFFGLVTHSSWIAWRRGREGDHRFLVTVRTLSALHQRKRCCVFISLPNGSVKFHLSCVIVRGMKTVKKCCNKNNSTVYSGAPTPSTFTAPTVQVAREKFNLSNQIHA